MDNELEKKLGIYNQKLKKMGVAETWLDDGKNQEDPVFDRAEKKYGLMLKDINSYITFLEKALGRPLSQDEVVKGFDIEKGVQQELGKGSRNDEQG